MKRIIALLLVFCAIIGFAACDIEDTSEDTSEGNILQPPTLDTSEERDVQYNEGFAIVTIDDCSWMKNSPDFVDVCVIGKIESISKTNDIVIIDAKNGRWTVDVGTNRDLSAYINTECTVFGFSTGGISSEHKTPFINMSHDNNKIVFHDEKTLYPENFESWKQFSEKPFENGTSNNGVLVWVPTDGGTKYHSKSTCSGMDNPDQVTKKEAIDNGYSKCGKCW